MNKKVLIIVALIAVLGIGLFVLTGCGNKNEVNTTSNANNNASDAKLITIGDYKIQLDKKDDYNGKVEYTYSSSFKLDNSGTTRFYSFVDKDDNELVQISVNTTYETPDRTISLLEKNYYNNNTNNVKSENKTINDMDCVYIEYNNTTKDIDYANHEYYYLFDKEDNNYFYLKIKAKGSLDEYKELEEELVNNVLLK